MLGDELIDLNCSMGNLENRGLVTRSQQAMTGAYKPVSSRRFKR
jgi:hypothetical protein